MERQDPEQVRRYVNEHMARLGCTKLVSKRWDVPLTRVKKGLKVRLGVGALIWGQDGRILLIKHHPNTGWDPDKWFTVGGSIEDDELPEDAIVREVQEEAGIQVKVLELHRVNNEILVHGELEADTYFFQFDVLYLSGEPRPRDGETVDVRWFHDLPVNTAFREDYLEAVERGRNRF